MLTFKHIMGAKEFAREIGSYVIDRSNDRVSIEIFEGDEFSKCLGIWGGHSCRDAMPEDMPSFDGSVYIMNSAGSTIAKAVYYAAETTLISENMEPITSIKDVAA